MSRGRVDPVDSTAVFLNVPYSPAYEPVFIALTTSLVTLGRNPRVAAEISDQGQGRIKKLHALLLSCRNSFHEISGERWPKKFNMPFELGLAWSIRETYPRRHDIHILADQRGNFDRELSDLKMLDPEVHHGTPAGAISAILNHLSDDNRDVTHNQIMPLAEELTDLLPTLKQRHGIDTLFKPRIYRDLVAHATVLAQDAGLIT